MTRWPRGLVAGSIVAGIALVGAARLAAQEAQISAAEVQASRPAAAPTLARPAMTLSEAVESAIKNSPQVRLSSQALRMALGQQQAARGLFDPVLKVSPSLDVTRRQLTPFLRNREEAKRATIQGIADNFTLVTQSLKGLIAATSTTPPQCPTGLSFGLDTLSVDQTDPKQLALLGVTKALNSNVTIELAQDIAGFNLSDICGSQVPTILPAEQFVSVWRKIDQSGGLGLGGTLTSVSQIAKESRSLEAQITEAVAVRAQLAVDRLGTVPEDDLLRHFSLDVGVSKALRSGITIDADFQMQSQEHTFVGKPLDPTFGGLETPAEFYSSASVTLDVPLLRGRGAVSAAAPERASERLLASQREQLRHDISVQTFQTILSYLNVVAAQQTLTLVQDSAGRQQTILGLSQRLVNSGDLPQADLARVRARAASVNEALEDARAQLASARLALAGTIGVDVDTIEAAPIATETFAQTPITLPATEALVQQALETRRDLKASEQRRDAAEILAAAARADQRRQLDFTLNAGYANLYDSPFFKYLPDEAAAIINTGLLPVPISSLTGVPVPPGLPVQFYSPRGFIRDLTGSWEPYVTAGFTLQLPFGNNAAKGRAKQAQANLTQSTIDAEDLHRVIGEQVVGVSEALRRAANEVGQVERAVASDNQILASELQRLQTGDATLIDTLLTEEDTTADQMRLVRVRQAYYSTLARLKFEAGDLTLFDRAGSPTETIRFPMAGLVTR